MVNLGENVCEEICSGLRRIICNSTEYNVDFVVWNKVWDSVMVKALTRDNVLRNIYGSLLEKWGMEYSRQLYFQKY